MPNLPQLIPQIHQAFQSADPDAFFACCTDDVVWDMGAAGRITDRATMAAVVRNKDYTNLEMTVHDTIVDGDRVAVIGHARMTHKEQGTTVGADFCDVYHLENGKVKYLRFFIEEAQPVV